MSSLDLRGRFTLSAAETAELTGAGRDATYNAIARNEIAHITRGRTRRVLTVPLLKQLGWTDDLIAEALGVRPGPEAAATVAVAEHLEEAG